MLTRLVRFLPYGLAVALISCGVSEPKSSSVASVRRDTAGPVKAWLPPLVLGRVGAEEQHCEPAVSAELAFEGSTFKGIVLSDVVRQPCGVMVSINKRFYELKPATGACGARVYTGELPGVGSVVVHDNAGLTCEVKPAGAIEVDEKDASGRLLSYAGGW